MTDRAAPVVAAERASGLDLGQRPAPLQLEKKRIPRLRLVSHTALIWGLC